MELYITVVLIFVLLHLLKYVLLKNKNYWNERNVPYVEPLPIFGNYKDFILLKEHSMVIAQKMCQQFPNEPYIGTFYGTDPALLVQDPCLLKLILTKDYYFFNGREIVNYTHKEVMTQNMFFAVNDYWKVLRTNLNPLFSSTKLKNMFYIIKECADTFESLLKLEVENNSHPDKRKLLSRYTMDCVVACVFGLRAKAMKNDTDENIFTSIGDKIFDSSSYRGFKIVSRSMWPKVFYGLGLKMFADDITIFFNNLLSDVFRIREETKSSKNDFVDLILTWKQQNCISGDSFENLKTGDKQTVSIKVTEELLVAQCILLFAAGFETTASTISFLLYELAKNQDAQSKVIKEVDEYFKNNDAIEFECTNSMPYTESCIRESLRLYPVLGLLTREVMHDYTLPTGLLLKKGTRVHIPVYHIHYNPDYFPEPEKFRPERFIGEERNNIKPYTHMPFGLGPRTCLGMRFAKMPMHAALLKIFKNYRVELAADMPKKIKFNPKSLITQSVDGIRLNFVPRRELTDLNVYFF